MSLYRCAICGSSKIVPETKKEGYNTKKGIFGAALFGGIGALAGTSGNKVTYYHCGDCGQVLNYTMGVIEKEAIEHCLNNPNVNESSLRTYKERYKNIEWKEEEKQVAQVAVKRLNVTDIENRIIEYIRNAGAPVHTPSEKEILGIETYASYEEKDLEIIAELNINMRTAMRNLVKRGQIKLERIGENNFYTLVTDINEMKELALKGEANEMAAKLVRAKDYKTILTEILTHNSMTCEEIYDYLKKNNYLAEDVLKAEKQNTFIPLYFTNACIKQFRSVDRTNMTRLDLLICEDDKYRLKTEEEIEESKSIIMKEVNEKVQEEVNTIMPLIIALQTAKKPITIHELYDLSEECKTHSNQTLASKLKQLDSVGVVKKDMVGKKTYFSLPDISQDEIEKKLFEAISNKKIRGFLY